MYEAVKDAKLISWQDALPPTLGGINFAEVLEFSAESITLENSVLTVKDLALSLGELALLDEGTAYTVKLAIARVKDGSETQTLSLPWNFPTLRMLTPTYTAC